MKIGAAGEGCLHHSALACYGFRHGRGGPVLLDIIIAEARGENLSDTALLQLGDIGAREHPAFLEYSGFVLDRMGEDCSFRSSHRDLAELHN
jgi:hypothetical protein